MAPPHRFNIAVAVHIGSLASIEFIRKSGDLD
jgi:hypothetical protein